MDSIVVINCGSSSVKVDVFDTAAKDNPMSVLVDRVGSDQCVMKTKLGDDKAETPLPSASHGTAVDAVFAAIKGKGYAVKAVGHRVVHGGVRFADSVVITDEVIAAITDCVPLAPLHNPPNLLGIEAAMRAAPDVGHVAVFDTAFHQTMPEKAWRYALPKALADEKNYRRFAFHGTSHRYVAERTAHFFARPIEDLKLVTLHLGNGCSACAIDAGKSIDSTMGMTPLEGLVMGTRSGDVDPAIVLSLARDLGADEAETLLNKQSGLKGMSEKTNDMRDVIAAADAGDANSLVALEVFCQRAKKAVGALACTLGGLDAIVFTGGIGENSARVRGMICDGLRVVGALLHERKNNASSQAERDLSTMDSRTRILVIPTDEEKAIAQDVLRLALR